ncbi:hypothetical protein ERO13_A03G041301v2 [Gossypium hirsutum]|nr:hypothetical protein ERO13_A03G041301v2 [Gossypium hirsutum]
MDARDRGRMWACQRAWEADHGGYSANCFQNSYVLLEFYVIGLGHLGQLGSWATTIWACLNLGLVSFWF